MDVDKLIEKAKELQLLEYWYNWLTSKKLSLRFVDNDSAGDDWFCVEEPELIQQCKDFTLKYYESRMKALQQEIREVTDGNRP